WCAAAASAAFTGSAVAATTATAATTWPALPAAALTPLATALTEQNDLVAIAKSGGAGGDDAHAFADPGRDLDFFGIRHAERHGLEFGDVAVAGHIHALLALRIDHGIGRHR